MTSLKKALFVVQGEGRGHLTQAIALSTLLRKNGYQVCAVLVGTSNRRDIPQFFYERIQTPVSLFRSPNFVSDKENKSISLRASLLRNLWRLPAFFRSMKQIGITIAEHQPDAIINFYDPLIGLYFLFEKPGIPLICIAHQYLFLHPRFEFPESKRRDRLAVKLFSRLTSLRATRKLAISLYGMPAAPEERISVVPPLLRKEVFEQEQKAGEYYLIYLLNSGYKEEILAWHQQYPDTEAHVFCDRPETYETLSYGTKLFFHKLNDAKFLKLMAGSKALVSTAGFESICEAMYMEKPVLMVPVAGHFEQYCNACDAHKAGAGIHNTRFDIGSFSAYIAKQRTDYTIYKAWLDQAENRYMEEVNKAIHQAGCAGNTRTRVNPSTFPLPETNQAALI
jgi:uncharacterized protein (TIGR00661 family)